MTTSTRPAPLTFMGLPRCDDLDCVKRLTKK